MNLFQEPNIEIPIMLHNHDSILLDHDKRKLYTIGGGGNCFSFGTHFNSSLLEITLQT